LAAHSGLRPTAASRSALQIREIDIQTFDGFRKCLTMISTSKLVAPFLLCASLHEMAQCAEVGAQAVLPASTAELALRVQDLLAKVKPALRLIKGGTFDMGDWGTESGQRYDIDPYSRPVHKVTLDSFSMMAYKVTYEDFDVFTDATGNDRVDMDPISISDRSPRRPAGVSWYGAKAYCKWLGEVTNLPFDLPSEAQWEYAARSGGKQMLFATDNGRIERPRNFPKEWTYGEKRPPLPDVGSFPANPAGLQGMSENTGEWVNDWFDEDYYKISPEANPSGPNTGTKKVKRGSVGGKAEIAAMVFMRKGAIPQALESTYPNGIAYDKRVMVPFAGYSSYHIDNFRCVVNSAQKVD
jgi:sulfatase modifying factor 1